MTAKSPSRAAVGRSRWTSRSHSMRQILPEIGFIILAAYLWYEAGEFRDVRGDALGPDFWPQLLTVLLGLTACVRLVRKLFLLRRANQQADDALSAKDEDSDDEPISRRKAGIVIALAIGYVPSVIYLGYPLATLLFMVVFLWLSGKCNWLAIISVSTIGTFVFTYTFQEIVFVALPTGVGVFDSFTVWLYRLLGIY